MWPDTTEPAISSLPMISAWAVSAGTVLSATLKRRFASGVDGNVKRARPVRVVTASSTCTRGLPSVTA